ncbi:branched-chain amino acid transport system 2 carrier protein [Candidatus Photodesmus katoptron]|uniref:Branched-chain amino acid transport system carrier protein n=1 Tax=Candidatus Photodesmus katoptron Akat1 TaxID=1236703 RepID=S3DJJ4_9GAMM|nr:branched-chain amino acid transport system II carrier protein [Candidatus Photodesmus katoptron]EPE37294.1 branched-chain amino acid transport system II carrier protein [Candidatus Photodesmus katoptron Akat1]KEY90035.1 branched-chain amino acid transport system 2 carrier protein [Candidatus Photodesmus katoptron]
MKQTLKLTDIVSLGFMLFAFFLGAGNIIFPPLSGHLSGDKVLLSTFGFLITAVGLPIITLIALAIRGGSWKDVSQDLPKCVALIISVSMFVIIGPAVAAPRTGLVAYEMLVKPFLTNTQDELNLALFSFIFFAITTLFAWSRGNLINIIGNLLTPILLISLIILAIAVMLNPQGEIIPAQGEYLTHALQKGFLEGYNTMDTFAALMFGVLLVDALRNKGINQPNSLAKYLIISALIAAFGLTFVYVSLFYLGSTSSYLISNPDNGAVILSLYVKALFGSYGQIALSLVVFLACLTTAIGLVSSCSDYFSSLTSISYKKWVIINGIACSVVANIGLSNLITLSTPVLFTLYPVLIALVTLAFLRKKLLHPKIVYRVVTFVALIFSIVDSIKIAGFDIEIFKSFPFFEVGMTWLLPTTITIISMFLIEFYIKSKRSLKSITK